MAFGRARVAGRTRAQALVSTPPVSVLAPRCLSLRVAPLRQPTAVPYLAGQPASDANYASQPQEREAACGVCDERREGCRDMSGCIPFAHADALPRRRMDAQRRSCARREHAASTPPSRRSSRTSRQAGRAAASTASRRISFAVVSHGAMRRQARRCNWPATAGALQTCVVRVCVRQQRRRQTTSSRGLRRSRVRSCR